MTSPVSGRGHLELTFSGPHMQLDFIIILAFLIFNILLGLFASKNIKTLDHFSVGGRSFGTFAIFATLTASYIGGGCTLGNAAKVYSVGMIYAFALLGFSLKEILVATIIAPRMGKHNDCLSIGDIMEKRYGRIAKIVTGIFAVILCMGILGAQVSAMGAVFATFFHIPAVWGIIIGFSVIIFYSTLGGMKAVVYTDIFQFAILVLGLPAVFLIGFHHAGGWHSVVAKVPEHHVYFIQNPHDFYVFLTLFVTFIFGETLVPPYVQRLFMAKDAVHTRNATLASAFLSMPLFLTAGAIGLLALYYNQSLDPNMALPYIVQTQLPSGIRGFVIAGLLSIIMSSAAGYLNASSVAFVNDIVRPITNDTLSHATLLKLVRVSTFIVGVGAIIFALMIENVLDIELFAYNFWSPIILVPLVAVILGFEVKARDFLLGSSAGGLAMVIWMFCLNNPDQLNGVVIGVLSNFVVFTISYQLRKRMGG